ncbi:hypothetical protein FHW77_001587 [Agrobacterium sp. RC10-4-1]|uniref:DUF6511 domain-containing protein n=1 Tax=Agrobacterium sp. RC10-4-1 TaxID=2587039 RepID=UPI0015F926DB|nr:DUF6511 domain-containing protein [Agrobacterium sp. RC10-4-1]MBA8797905.1 hypothetical protein [Agrobacterium sp. RC10-4-1]
MTKLPGQPVLPITPTADENDNPTTCMCCGRIAIGIGRAIKQGARVIDNGFLCKQCIVAVGDLSKMDRLSIYELKALDAGVDAVGEYIAEHGVTELAHFDELMQRMMVKAAITGFAKGVREALKEAPF